MSMTDVDQRSAAERAAADKAAADRTKAEEERKKAIDKQVAEDAKTRDEQVRKAYEHPDPWPSQAELDAMKLMAMPGVDSPEPASSSKDKKKAAEAAPGTATYQTRAAEPPKTT